MRILIHDYAGHPFQVQLSRALAARGHEVAHAYCASLVTTPQATLSVSRDDPPGLMIEPIDLGEPLDKSNLLKRWRQERRYGRLAEKLVRRIRPEVVLSANTPLDAQSRILGATHSLNGRFLFWVQDLIGVAAARLLREKVPVVGGLVGRYYERLEAAQLRKSDGLVLITEDFREAVPVIRSHPNTHVVPNWAPLDAVPEHPRDNAWSREQGLGDRLRFIYSGTLGLKHNPELLAALARRRPEADVIVVSQGAGADWLRANATDLPNLHLLPFQPFDRLPEVLAAADVLVAVLEPDAGVFSVPSKVLTNLCAGRAQLLAVPPENLAARIVADEGAGLVVDPRDEAGFLDQAAQLATRTDPRRTMGRRARQYAEKTFDIERIADTFEDILL